MPSFSTSSPYTREAARLLAVHAGTKPTIQRAVTTVRRRLPVEARRDIQDEYNLPAKRIAQDLSVTSDDVSVTLTGGARYTGLEAFDGKWGGLRTAGAVAKVFTAEPAHVYGGTFMAIGRHGNRQIFDRTTPYSLPLKSLKAPTVASMLRKGDREKRLADFVHTTLATEIVRLLKITGI